MFHLSCYIKHRCLKQQWDQIQLRKAANASMKDDGSEKSEPKKTDSS